MQKVNRYSPHISAMGSFDKSDDGIFVLYKDYLHRVLELQELIGQLCLGAMRVLMGTEVSENLLKIGNESLAKYVEGKTDGS